MTSDGRSGGMAPFGGAQIWAEAWREAMEAQLALLRCRTPAEVAQVQGDMVRAGAAFHARLAAAALAGFGGIAPVQTARRYDDVPL